MRLLSCPNCGAPVDPPAGDERVLTCGFCHRSFERDAERPAIEGLAPSTPRERRGRALVAVLAASLGALVAVVALRRTPAPPTPPVPPSPAPTPARSVDPPTRLAVVPPPRDVAVEAGPPLDLETGPVALQWSGRLTSSTGAAPRVGSPCTLTATVSSGEDSMAHQDLLTFQCAGQVLYDSSIPLNGMSSSSFGLDEVPVAGEALVFQYAMRAEDLGSRTGPGAQISLSTPDALLEAFRETVPSFRVHARIDHLSAVRRGKALTAGSVPLFEGVVVRKAKVVARSGAVPFGGAACELRVSPGYRTENECRALLTCGGRALYGGGTQGFVSCEIADGAPRTFVDAKPTPTDGDPEMSGDLGAGTAVLGDTLTSGATYSMTLELTATPP